MRLIALYKILPILQKKLRKKKLILCNTTASARFKLLGYENASIFETGQIFSPVIGKMQLI